MIFSLIKRRYINSLDLCGTFQKFCSGPATALPLLVGIQQFVVNRFSLSDIEQIKKLASGSGL